MSVDEARKVALDHLLEGLRLYVDRGVVPGSFLTACIDNNLSDAVARADAISALALVDVVRWLYNDAPSPCWGSPEKRAAWIKRGGLRGFSPPPCSACKGSGRIEDPESTELVCPECDGEGVRRASP